MPGSHMTGNTYGAIGAPQRQYRGETGLGMEASSQEESRPSVHVEESLRGAYPPALTGHSCRPGPALGPRDPWGEAGI